MEVPLDTRLPVVEDQGPFIPGSKVSVESAVRAALKEMRRDPRAYHEKARAALLRPSCAHHFPGDLSETVQSLIQSIQSGV